LKSVIIIINMNGCEHGLKMNKISKDDQWWYIRMHAQVIMLLFVW
jgi:hypothetical protein